MPHETYQAWLALYLAVAILAGLTMTLSVLKTIWDIRSGTFRLPIRGWKNKAAFAPRLWLRFHLNYLSGAPVILLVSLAYAHHLGFGLLGNV